MGLIGNRTILAKLPLTQIGGTFADDIREFKNWHCRENADPKCAIPNGYNQGGAWLLPQVAGGLSLFYGADGNSNINNANLAGGLSGVVSMQGDGDIINAQAGLIIGVASIIYASAEFNSDINGLLYASASLAGQGDISGALGALANAVAQITGNSPTSCAFVASGSLTSVITSASELSPERLAAAVWNAYLDSYVAGTAGADLALIKKLNLLKL